MRACKCDACGRFFELDPSGSMPMQIQEYVSRGVYNYIDLCEDCAERIAKEFKKICLENEIHYANYVHQVNSEEIS